MLLRLLLASALAAGLSSAAQAQNLASGKVNTGSPTYSNDQNVPLQMDASGALKVTSGSSGTSTGSVTSAGTNGTQAQAVQGITGGVPQNVKALGIDGSTDRQIKVTTTGALEPPTAASGKITATSVALSATTSTQLVAANANRIGLEIQCDGTATVGLDMAGGTLTSVAASPRVIPAGSYPLYTPPIATLTAITAYTGTGQTCRVTEYLR